MKTRFTITVFSENKPGLLYRISGLLLRRKINVESMTVSEIEKEGVSRFTIVVNGTKETIDKVVNQLYRIIEVLKVYENTDDQIIAKELAFIKVKVTTVAKRKEIEKIINSFEASIANSKKDSLVIQLAGSEARVNSLLAALKPFGILEFTRTGRIAVLKE